MNKIFFLFFFSSISSFQLQRAILAVDTHEKYQPYWPFAARAWKRLIGIKPTLFLVAPPDFKVNEEVGEVIRFDPVPGIPTGFQAQVIRLLVPALFPDEICILSDVDMVPINKRYFTLSVKGVSEETMVVYKQMPCANEYAMCYVAGKGKLFGKLFGIHNPSFEAIREKIKEWWSLKLGWATDQRVLYKAVQDCVEFRIKKLDHDYSRRIDRAGWKYDENKIRYYIDCHMSQPFNCKKPEETVLRRLGLFS